MHELHRDEEFGLTSTVELRPALELSALRDMKKVEREERVADVHSQLSQMTEYDHRLSPGS